HKKPFSPCEGSANIGRRGPMLLTIPTQTKMTRDPPAAIDDKKKETGMTGDHHCGASLSGMSKKREPSELWCIVESVTAAIANIIGSAFLSLARNAQARRENTTAAAAVYFRSRDSR